MDEKDRAMIETALGFDADTLYTEDLLSQQAEVETHYNRAAQLYRDNDLDLAQEHEQQAYQAAENLRDTLIHDEDMGSKWGREYREMLEQ